MAASADPLDTLTVALLDSVNLGHATAPANDSERLLFRNLFDTPVRLDCQNRLLPGVVQSWTRDTDGNSWVLKMRDDAAFPVAGPMSAAAVASTINLLAITDSASWQALGIDTAITLDQRRFRVVARGSGGDSVPRFLAHPALVLIDGLASESGTGEGSLAIPRRAKLPVIDFRFPLARDARDAVDRDVDLLVTRDPVLVDYVANRNEFVTFPLPWSRTYVLLEGGDRQGALAGKLTEASARSSLAQDAVSAGARASEPPYWWTERATCGSVSPVRSGPVSSRVVYRADDAVARALAERIVALAPTGIRLRAAGLDGAEFTAALTRGGEWAYILGVPRQSLAPCRDAAVWLAGAEPLPLIDTRAYAIVRRGAPPLTVEWDGTLRVVEP